MPGDVLASSNAPAGGSLAQRLAVRAIRGYQLMLAPMYAGSCRYLPSCSAYALEAVERHGATRGGLLALRRLMRCHPFGGHGLDPVPAFAPSELRRGKPAPSEARRGTPAPSEARRRKPADAPSAGRRGTPADAPWERPSDSKTQ